MMHSRFIFRLAVLACALFSGGCGGGGGTSSPVQQAPPPPVSVAVSPSTASVVLGATQQFSATVSGSANSAVNWAVNGVAGGNTAVGTVSSGGLYTAPQNLPTPVAVTVTATSQADPSKSASATTTVQSDLVVTISPDPASVELGATQQFAAAVSSAGNPNRTLTWAVNGIAGGSANVGTITASGSYTAPQILPSPPAITITATSQADPSKTDTALANVTSTFAMSLSGPASLNTGTAGAFSATVLPVAGSNPNLALTWNVNGVPNGDTAVGQICAAGAGPCIAPTASANTVEYRAPLVAPANPVVTITAVSVADPSKSASSTLMINSVVAVTISPSVGVAVVLGGTVQFTATVSGTTDQRVVWDVNGMVGGDQNTIGAISNPPTLTGPADYFAPAQLPGGANTVTVRATSQFDATKSASVSVQLFSNVVVAVSTGSGADSSLRAVGRTEKLCVGIANASNNAVTWTVNGVLNGNAAVGTIAPGNNLGCPPLGPPGSIVSSFDYTAPAAIPNPPDVVATATSVADPSRIGSVTITILPAPLVTIFPTTSSLPTNGIAQFSATVTGTPILGVSWLVNGVLNGDATNGLICVIASNPCQAPASPALSSVEYRASANVPANPSITITADGADGGSGSATVTVTAPPTVIQPTITGMLPASITEGVASPFTLKVLGTNFVAGTGSGASVILFGSPAAPKTTSCNAPAGGPQDCTATVDPIEVASAGNIPVQIRNPDTTLSTPEALVVVPATVSEEVIALTPATPQAAGKDIIVVEPLTAGSGVQTLNINIIGVILNNACSAQGSPIAIQRPAAGSITVDLCLGGTGLLASQTYTLSGTGDITVGVPQSLALGIVQVRLPLTIPSTAQKGARTLFVENSNKEKSAATGAIEIK